MNLKRRWLSALFCGLAVVASAQAEAPGTVNATASASVKLAPQSLRVQLDLVAQNKDLKTALAQLKERRDAAQLAIVGLGFEKGAVTFSNPRTISASTQQQQMRRFQMRQRGRKAKKSQESPAVVSLTMKATMPLKSTDVDSALLLASSLVEKIRAADLSGSKAAEKSEEEEEADEQQEMEMMMSGGERKPTDPFVVFVSRISSKDMEKTMATAFARAKAQADSLARAAGAKVGELTQLSATPGSQYGMEGIDPSDYQMMHQMGLRSLGAVSESEDDDGKEAIGIRPDNVRYSANVSVAFSLAR